VQIKNALIETMISLLVWLFYIILSFFIIRPLENVRLRGLCSVVGCALVTTITCQDLPLYWARTMFIVGACWMFSIRLFHLTTFPRQDTATFPTFVLQLGWSFLPLMPCTKTPYYWPILFDLISGIVKLFIHHWIYRWFLTCSSTSILARVVMYYLLIITLPFVIDFETVLVRVLTGNRYTLTSFTEFPWLSRSLRIFWGRRYNRIVHLMLKEAIFETYRCSPSLAALLTFTVSGIFHVHIILAIFGDTSHALPTFAFFFVQGLACCAETHFKIDLPEHVGWCVTHGFLLFTSPWFLRPFIALNSSFLIENPPPLFDASWLPQLPLPHVCLGNE
jgi:hypothetical protein